MAEPDESPKIEYVRSRHSGDGNCVEAGHVLPDGLIAVRHSKRQADPPLLFSREEWDAFVQGVKDGQFDFSW